VIGLKQVPSHSETVIHRCNLQEQKIDFRALLCCHSSTETATRTWVGSCFWGMWSVMLSVLDGSLVELGKPFFFLCWQRLLLRWRTRGWRASS
jgi:hypothetical protein